MENWPYAALVQEAHLYGGPDNFRAALKDSGLVEGRMQGCLVAVLISSAILGLGYLFKWQTSETTTPNISNENIAKTTHAELDELEHLDSEGTSES